VLPQLRKKRFFLSLFLSSSVLSRAAKVASPPLPEKEKEHWFCGSRYVRAFRGDSAFLKRVSYAYIILKDSLLSKDPFFSL